MPVIRLLVALPLVAAGAVFVGGGLLLASPGMFLVLVGLLLVVGAGKLFQPARPPLVVDDPVDDDDDDGPSELWRDYLSHPSAVGFAQRKVRGEDG